jgi:acetyltransferase-like isoleucine patch superfamily enzyme
MSRIVGTFLNRAAFVSPGGHTIRPQLHRWRGASIGRNVWVGLYVYIDDLHPAALSIGDNCTIGLRTSIFTHFYWGPRRTASNGKVVIENDVFIGPHCVILPNVRIGEGAVIKAGTVVSRNVPPRTFWGAPQAEALGEVTVPLTSAGSYAQFVRGIRPVELNSVRLQADLR